MKRYLLIYAILMIGISFIFAQDYVMEWEGPNGFGFLLDNVSYHSSSTHDFNNDGFPEIVLKNYDGINTVFNVYDPVDNYSLLFTNQVSGNAKFIGFANITDESSDEMVILIIDTTTDYYIINTSTFESFFLISEGSLTIYDFDNDSKDEIILSTYQCTYTQIWGDGTQSSTKNNIPQSLIKLSQNFPNPFNPTTTINYELNNDGFVNLRIFNVKGQLVDTIVNREESTGKHSVIWNAKGFSSGQYFYQISVDGKAVQTKKAICLK
jgi:Secretion system C-terminal sorting domain